MTPAGPTLAIPNTIYSYAVSAVDTSGHEGPLQSDATFWAYYNGVWNWEGDYSYPGGQIHIDYADTTGAPEEGPADIKVTCDTAASGFLPFSGKTTTQWDMEGGSFHYIQLDLKPTLPGQDWELFVVSRLPVIGDNTPWALLNSLSGYGPVPAVVGAWNHYKIPLSAFDMGFSHMTASISGSNLIVTSVESGGGLVGVGSGGYVTGPGVPTGTTITGNGPSNGGPGTYPIQGPGISSTTSVPSTAMVEQHTAIYKFGLVDRNSSVPSSNVYFIDNVKFTVD
jgi:hypothetical protein